MLVIVRTKVTAVPNPTAVAILLEQAIKDYPALQKYVKLIPANTKPSLKNKKTATKAVAKPAKTKSAKLTGAKTVKPLQPKVDNPDDKKQLVSNIEQIVKSIIMKILKSENLNPENLNPENLNPESLNPESLNPESLNPESLKPESLKTDDLNININITLKIG